MTESRRLTLFYPVRSIGGAQLAFARIAREMGTRLGWQIVLVDYADGFVRSTLAAWQVQFDFIEWRESAAPLDIGETTLFLSLGGLPHALQSLRADPLTRVLFWTLHPHAITAFFKFGFLYNRLSAERRHFFSRILEPFTRASVSRLLLQIEEKEALLFMDGPNVRYFLTMGCRSVDPRYLPVPITRKDAFLLRAWNQPLSIGWLGRLAEDKSYTICAMLDLCSCYAKAHSLVIDFHIIGDGPAHARLQKLEMPGLRLFFPGVLKEKKLADYVSKNLKVGFAMGTSLLEFAIMGIPVLIGDYTNVPITGLKLPLRWFVPNEDYSLGEVIDERLRPASVKIAEVVDICRNETANRELGNLCREYAVKNHQIDKICEKLTARLQATKYCFESARPIIGRGERPWGPRLARVAAWWRNSLVMRKRIIPQNHIP